MPRVSKARNPDRALAELSEVVEGRYKTALKIFDYQDELTQEAIQAIADRMKISTTGVVQINDRPIKLPPETIEKNTFFLAVEIITNLALMGVRIANYQFNPRICGYCRRSIVKKAIKRQKRR